jgi:uncharacterized protein (TIGR02271 family)
MNPKSDRLARDEDEVIIPVVEEGVDVERRRVETGRVRASKVVSSREEVVDEPLSRDEVHVERVAVNRVVDGPSGARREGDTLIVSVYEEVLIVEKRLMLKEEVRITTRKHVEREPQAVTLRSEDVVVERLPPEGRAAEP